MNFYDAFAGIGGFHLGITQAHPDWKCSGACEIDGRLQKKYSENFQGVGIDGDIRKIDKLPKGTQLLCGGFPCQDLSLVGKRAGLAGKRSGLFYELCRVADNSKTPMLLLENVAGLLSSNGGWDFARVVLELEEIGYAVQWAVLNTIEVLPQNRERVFVVATLGGEPRQKVFPIGEDGEAAYDEEPAEGVEQTTYALKARDYANWGGNFVEIPAVVGHTRDATGKESSFHMKNSVGTLKGRSGNQEDFLCVPDFAPTLTGGGHSGGLHGDMLAIPVLTPDRLEKRQNGRRFKNQGEASFTLTSQDKHGVMVGGGRIRRLTPIECERLQGFPDNWTAGLSDTQRYRALGNAVSVPVVKAIAERLPNLGAVA